MLLFVYQHMQIFIYIFVTLYRKNFVYKKIIFIQYKSVFIQKEILDIFVF